jgi:uncharacterized repeat protein (TIGR01451 family)
VALTGVAFTDTLPAGVTVPSTSISQCGGTLTSTTTTITLGGATIAGGGTCTFSITATGTTAGTKNNTTSAVTSTNGGTGNTASASLEVGVVSPPAITKSFTPSSILVGATSSLTFTITNPNPSVPLTGVAFTDTLPAGVTVPSTSIGQCGGTLTSTTTTITLAGASIAAGGTCTFSVTVTGTTAGTKTNTTSAVTSTNGGTGNTACASLEVGVVSPPAITKSFTPSSISVGTTSSLSFTITNPNATVALTGVAFTDTLPAGVTVPSTSIGQCGGTLTTTATTISLSGATIAASGTCSFSITATGTTLGAKVNTTSAVTSTNGGTGNTASATLEVGLLSAPTISKAFGAASISVGATTSLSFTITNPNAGSSLAGVALTDTFPSGLVIANPNGLTGSCGGGTITATPGSNSASLASASLPANSSCTFSVTVTATVAGSLTNVTGPVTSSNAGTGKSATASITVSMAADSQRLRALQFVVTKLEAQASGAAFDGAVNAAVTDGFADCNHAPPTPIRASGGGLRFNFGCEWQVWADLRGTEWITSQQTGDIRGGQTNGLFGVTRKVTPDLLIGVLGGYEVFAYTSVLLDGRLKGDGWTVGGYLGWRPLPGIRVDAGVARSDISYDGVAGTASGRFPAERWLATAALIGTYKIAGFEVEPSARVYAAWEHENAYTDSLGTPQGIRNFSSGRASAGAQVAYPWLWTDTTTLTPYVGLYADYYFNQDDAALPVAPLLLPNQFLQGWSARVTAGVGVATGGGRFSIGGEVGGLGSDQFITWSVRARASVPF